MRIHNPKPYLAAVMSLALAACGGDGIVLPDPAPAAPAPAPAPPPAAVSTCPTVGNIEPVELGTDQCQISGELTENATLTAEETWFLEGLFQVGNESTSVTLNIEAGTQLRGDSEGSVDHMVVYPGSALSANGTSANPVQFLSDDEGVDGSGEWGGLFLRGTNGTSLTMAQGANSLDYVVVAEAGASVDVTIDNDTVTYQDNIVVNGVDSNTTLTFVQSHNSARDGFHILNGDARMSWLLATGSGRDGVWYQDFNGLIKDLMVIHNPDANGTSGRAGIYASETVAGNSNPRIVNATLVGRDSTSENGIPDTSANEFGILFADNTDEIRMGNVLIANFRNGCFEADSDADLSGIDSDIPGPTYLDGVHCANEAGLNPNFGVIRAGSTGFPAGVVAPNNSINANGFLYYNGAANPITFTGEFVDRTQNFTSSWYLDNIGGIGNGLAGDSTFLNGFLDGDTNQDGVLNGDDNGAPFIISDMPFNQDVAADTFGYDLTHVGAVRGGAITNAQFDGWTVATGPDDGFVVQVDDALTGDSTCPAVGDFTVTALPRAAGRNVCQISGTTNADATLTSDIEWELEDRVQVGSSSATATLTINNGTRISGDNVDATDFLLIYPGSSIAANGSGARPIRFTSDDADIDGSGEWGGLFLRGDNGTSVGLGQGNNLLDYVVVAEAGAPVTVDDIPGAPSVTYQDNIVLNGVDENTLLTFVQSHNSARDGFRILNGDPRMSWLLATGAQSDGVWYRDFTGLIKDLMVIHNPDSGRAGIYASETVAGDSDPRIVNATLVGRDNTSEDGTADTAVNEFGILFADNTDSVRMGNILIANFRNGCFEVDSAANLSAVDTQVGGNYLDGVHCANEAGANGNFGVVRGGSTGFPVSPVPTVAPNNSPNADGLVYYNGAGGELPGANTPFTMEAGGINLTGELVNRRNNFTSGWYLNNIRGFGNGLVGNPLFLNGFLDGDTNQDTVVDASDTNSPFIISNANPFNLDVAGDTFGYDLTHIGAVRGGAVSNAQFDNWTVDTLRSSSFTVRVVPVNN